MVVTPSAKSSNKLEKLSALLPHVLLANNSIFYKNCQRSIYHRPKIN